MTRRAEVLHKSGKHIFAKHLWCGEVKSHLSLTGGRREAQASLPFTARHLEKTSSTLLRLYFNKTKKKTHTLSVSPEAVGALTANIYRRNPSGLFRLCFCLRAAARKTRWRRRRLSGCRRVCQFGWRRRTKEVRRDEGANRKLYESQFVMFRLTRWTRGKENTPALMSPGKHSWATSRLANLKWWPGCERTADPDATGGSDLCALSFEQQQRDMNLASLTSFFPSFSVSYLLNSSALSLSVWTLTRPSCCPAVQAALQ